MKRSQFSARTAENNLSPKVDLKIDWATHDAAKFAVENWHYSKCLPAGKIVKVGVWENKKFIGVVLFSRGANNNLGKPYGLSTIEVCELTRIALTKHNTTVSRIVSIAMLFLKKNSPGLRLIISYADPDQNHHGGVYQAGGWIYAGKTTAADEYIVHGARMHGRSMRQKYGTHVGKSFIKKCLGSSKHRYLKPLDNLIRDELTKLSKTYPKRALSKEIVASGFRPEEGGASPTNALQKEHIDKRDTYER